LDIVGQQPGDGLVAALSALLSPAASLPNLGAAPGVPSNHGIPVPPPMPIPNMVHFLHSVQVQSMQQHLVQTQRLSHSNKRFLTQAAAKLERKNPQYARVSLVAYTL